MAATMVDRPRPHPAGYLLALGVGLTWASNAVGGGTLVFSLLIAVAASMFGWRRRGELGVVLAVGFLPAVLMIVAALAAG